MINNIIITISQPLRASKIKQALVSPFDSCNILLNNRGQIILTTPFKAYRFSHVLSHNFK